MITGLKTQILPAGEAAVAAAARALGEGRLVAFPTETVYGLGADATNAAAIARLYAAKGRPAFNPLIAHVGDIDAARRIGRFDAAALALAEAFWPGPLSLVLPGGSGQLPDSLRGPEGGIAVRWTSHRGMARLAHALGEPVTSTSANLPGAPPAPGAEAIARDFAPAVEAGTLLVLDGGVLGNSPPSTVVDCTRPAPRLIREGALTLAELRRAAGQLAP